MKKTCKKKKKEGKRSWEMKLNEILCRRRSKNLAKHKNVAIDFFNGKLECSLITIVTFSENVAINKRYATKTIFVTVF